MSTGAGRRSDCAPSERHEREAQPVRGRHPGRPADWRWHGCGCGVSAMRPTGFPLTSPCSTRSSHPTRSTGACGLPSPRWLLGTDPSSSSSAVPRAGPTAIYAAVEPAEHVPRDPSRPGGRLPGLPDLRSAAGVRARAARHGRRRRVRGRSVRHPRSRLGEPAGAPDRSCARGDRVRRRGPLAARLARRARPTIRPCSRCTTRLTWPRWTRWS